MVGVLMAAPGLSPEAMWRETRRLRPNRQPGGFCWALLEGWVRVRVAVWGNGGEDIYGESNRITEAGGVAGAQTTELKR
jgi:hypothetical protein